MTTLSTVGFVELPHGRSERTWLVNKAHVVKVLPSAIDDTYAVLVLHGGESVAVFLPYEEVVMRFGTDVSRYRSA